jgi:HEAT repeat protein
VSAVEALERISPTCQQALDELAVALGSECKSVREGAAVALLRVCPHHKKALQTLRQMMEDKHWDRSHIILGLRVLGEKAKPLTPALIACLQDEYVDVRGAAAQILGVIKADPAVTVPALAGALKDPDEYVRTFAAQSLGDFGAKAKMAVPALIGVFRKDKSDMCRSAAIQALGEIGPPAAKSAPALVDLLAQKNPDIRLFAAQSLGEIGAGAKDAAPALAEIAKKDPDRKVRFMAVQALAQIGRASKVVIPTLKELLRDPDEGVRDGASKGLRGLGENIERRD